MDEDQVIFTMHNHIWSCEECQEQLYVPEIRMQGYAAIILAAHA